MVEWPNPVDSWFADHLDLLFDHGEEKPDRTGTGTLSLFGKVARFNLIEQTFPLLTLKHTNFNAIKAELLWFLRGETNTNTLDSSIWDDWADENGDVGPVYGKQWRSWQGTDGAVFDQIQDLCENLKTNPHSRRHIVSAWSVGELDQMGLMPCHYAMQLHVSQNTFLDIMVHQRSADLMLGVPFNFASYALLQQMIAQVCNLVPGRYYHTFGDLHIYNNHLDAASYILTNRESTQAKTKVELNPDIKDIDGFGPDDIRLVGYEAHPKIPLPIAV